MMSQGSSSNSQESLFGNYKFPKMEENSPPRFWPDFLFSNLTYATYLGVLENI